MGKFELDTKTIRPILQSKKNPKVTDPIRYPNTIEPIENQAKRDYTEVLLLTFEELSKEMVSMKKSIK